MAHKITFVIPAYNSEKTLGKCLESIKNFQGRKEIIVVDDGSTDNTYNVAKKYTKKVLRKHHSGPAKTRNVGWRNAKYETIVFVDSDIVINKSILKMFLSQLKNYDILIPGKDTFDVGLTIENFRSPEDFTFIKKKVLEEIGGFSEIFPWPAAEDADMLINALKKGFKCKCIRCDYVDLMEKSGKRKYSMGRVLKFWISNFVMNLKNIDTVVAKQWLLRKMVGIALFEYLRK